MEARSARGLCERIQWEPAPETDQTAGGPGVSGRIELINTASVPVTRCIYRGSQVPSPWTAPDHRKGSPPSR
jgi:hypothetical protein